MHIRSEGLSRPQPVNERNKTMTVMQKTVGVLAALGAHAVAFAIVLS